jgi:hypothetical protein
MEILLKIIGIIIGFSLAAPWVICWFNREGNMIDQYLDWVDSIVNK